MAISRSEAQGWSAARSSQKRPTPKHRGPNLPQWPVRHKRCPPRPSHRLASNPSSKSLPYHSGRPKAPIAPARSAEPEYRRERPPRLCVQFARPLLVRLPHRPKGHHPALHLTATRARTRSSLTGPRRARHHRPHQGDGESSNGRTADSDSACLGSNPSPPANCLPSFHYEFPVRSRRPHKLRLGDF